MMIRIGMATRAMLFVAASGLLAVSTASSASASQRHFLTNGLSVELFTAESLAAELTTIDGKDAIPLDGNRYLSVITDINDAAIYNKGDGSFHPFSVERVLSSLEGVLHPNIRLDIKVYVLPYPRRNLLVSSTSGNEVFLSPHVLDIDPAVAAYIVAHELGHVFHNAYMPPGSRQWNDYRSLRGITDESLFSTTASHPYRPQEILAEDFRVLFGGELAAYGGQIENHEIAPPTAIFGLREFFEGLGGAVASRAPKLVATNSPNPFNPITDIRITLPDADNSGVEVSVFDARGRLIRRLFEGTFATSELLLRWDGTDRVGTPVASGNYYARVRAGDRQTTLKLVLLK